MVMVMVILMVMMTMMMMTIVMTVMMIMVELVRTSLLFNDTPVLDSNSGITFRGIFFEL